MKKGQSNRLTMQQKEGQGPVTIFHKDTRISFGVQSKAVQMLSTLSRAMYCPFFIFEIILAEILAALIS